jgi:uncharacterized membrane protein YhhN
MSDAVTVTATAAIVVSAVLAIRAHYLGPRALWRVYLFKPLTTVLILLLAALAPTLDSRYGVAIVVGLGCSLVGDVFLMLPKDRFLPGLVSFLLAHIAYLAAFTGALRYQAILVPLVPYVVFGGGMLLVLWPGLQRRLRIPVTLYVLVITLMAGAALGRWTEFRTLAALGAAIGAGLFVVSDALLALALDRFRWSLRASRTAVLGTYWMAQYLIALSVRG